MVEQPAEEPVCRSREPVLVEGDERNHVTSRGHRNPLAAGDDPLLLPCEQTEKSTRHKTIHLGEGDIRAGPGGGHGERGKRDEQARGLKETTVDDIEENGCKKSLFLFSFSRNGCVWAKCRSKRADR